MAAYTDIIATVGGSTSNSYVTGVEADDYAAFQAWSSTWTGKSESERTIALLNACRWLDTLDYAGDRCNPSSDDSDLPQARSWPRSGASCDGVQANCSFVPKEVKEAQILIAYNLVVNPELITGTPGGGGGGAAAGTYVASQELGDLKISFAEYSNSDSASANECSTCDTPAIISALPWLKGILACWADISTPSTGSGKVILRVRS